MTPTEIGLYKSGKRLPSIYTVRKMEDHAFINHSMSIVDIMRLRKII